MTALREREVGCSGCQMPVEQQRCLKEDKKGMVVDGVQ
jgi:hypothetical protein